MPAFLKQLKKALCFRFAETAIAKRGFPVATLVVSLAGCATPHVDPPSLTAENGSATFMARSLKDENLRQFLVANLGHEPDGWDFETLCWVAFYYHPSLELARAQWATARATAEFAGERPNPSLTLTPGYNTTREPGISPWFPGINLDFLFQSSRKRARAIDIAAADAEAARLAIFSSAWQVRSELRKALMYAATAERRATVLRDQAEMHRQLLALLEQRFAAGSIAAGDVSIGRSARLRAETAAAEAGNQAAVARARVAAALGVPLAALDGVTLTVPTMPPSLTPAALSAARRQSLETRPDVLAALAKYRSAQAALELEIAKQRPDFHLGPGYQWDQGANKWSLALTFELPVFHRNEAGIAIAEARRSEAVAQFNVVQAQVVATLDAAIAAQAAAATQLDQAQRLRAEAEQQRLRIAQRLAVGGADQVEMQSAKLDLAAADAAVLDAEAGASAAAGQLEDALQIPFSRLTSLADPARGTSSRPL